MPLQPDGVSRVRGVNSLARLPVRGGAFSQDVALQIGYCTQCLTGLDAALNSVLWVAIVCRVAVATAPGAAVQGDVEHRRSAGVEECDVLA